MSKITLTQALLKLVLLGCLALPTQASSFVEFLVTAEITGTRNQNGRLVADLKVLKCQDLERGYGGKLFKAGQVFKNIELDQTVKTGEVRKLKYLFYSAMSPTGPISSETWTVED